MLPQPLIAPTLAQVFFERNHVRLFPILIDPAAVKFIPRAFAHINFLNAFEAGWFKKICSSLELQLNVMDHVTGPLKEDEISDPSEVISAPPLQKECTYTTGKAITIPWSNVDDASLPIDEVGHEDSTSKFTLFDEQRRLHFFKTRELKIAELVPETILLSEEVVRLSVDWLICKARNLISNENFQDALGVLAAVLREDTFHQESIYLMAFCYFNLSDDLQALRVLAPLRGRRMDRHLANLVEALRIDVRRRLLLATLHDTILFLANDEYDNAISHLRELVDLAPEEGLFQFLLSGSLISADRLRETMESPDIFISYADKDGEIAVQLAIELESHGYTTWYYDRDSRIIESCIKQICQAIDGAAAIAIIISSNCFRSYEMDKEIIHAHKKQKRFIPILCGLSHAEFQEMKPEWDHIFGAAPSIRIPPEGVTSIISNLIKGLKGLGIVPVAARPKEY